jgi:DNA-binding PucR family transcriptional regulator
VAATLDSADRAVSERAGRVLAFVPDPSAPGRRAQLEQAVGSRLAALGPTVAVHAAARSAERARRAFDLRAAGALRGEGLVVAEEHATELLLHADTRLAGELASARLAPLDALRPASRARLIETLRAWLDRQGRVDETARALDIHPQTVRYRLAQLREAFGPALDDAEARFEMALALRVRSVDGSPSPSASASASASA